MNHNESLISVIIPVYNGEKYLAECVESVLAQTYRPIEVIVVDDGSTDNSAAIAGRYESIRYFYQPNGGLSSALNSGIGIAQGDYYAFLDADDIWTKDKLSLQMAAFAEKPDLDMVFGHHQKFYSPELAVNGKAEIVNEGERLPGWFKGTALIKRKSFGEVGLFDTRWRLGDFIDWFKRATEKGLRMEMLPDVLMRRRVHAENKSYLERHAKADYIRIIKASFDRQRQKGQSGNVSAAGIEDTQEKS